MPGRIDGQRALRQRGSSRRRIHLARADAAQDHVDPRDQLARAERLCHVIVAADLEFQHAIDLVVARGEKQDRHVGGLSDLAADFKPVKLGHADVEDDEVRPVGARPSLPSRASVTVMPALRSATRMTSRMCRSSSTARMRWVNFISGQPLAAG
jgi:hypothetical protein